MEKWWNKLTFETWGRKWKYKNKRDAKWYYRRITTRSCSSCSFKREPRKQTSRFLLFRFFLLLFDVRDVFTCRSTIRLKTCAVRASFSCSHISTQFELVFFKYFLHVCGILIQLRMRHHRSLPSVSNWKFFSFFKSRKLVTFKIRQE